MAYVVAIIILIKLALRRNLYYFVFTCTSVGLVSIIKIRSACVC